MFSCFIIINLLVAFICITNSIISYVNGDEIILASRHVLFIHRSYYSFYLIISLAYLLSSNNKLNFVWMNTSFFKIFSVLVMFSSIVMGQSKAGVISMFFLLGFIFLDYRKMITKKIIIGFGIVSILFFIVFGNTLVSRFRPMINSLTSDKEINVNAPGSTGARIQLSKSALQLINKKPLLGYGTGDVKDELKKQNQENGFVGAVKRNYNAHNQFLNSWVALGIVGFLLLLSIFVFPFIDAYKHGNLFSIAFIVILFFNCLPEAWLEQQAGIVSSVLFICLLPFTNKIS